MRDRIIGPYFFAEKTVTANTYLDMLQLYAVPQLPDGVIFQQDGAPPHFANMVRTFLDEQFPARWIGRGSPYITWPARSPDLTPPDFFLWGFVKDQVYRTPVRDYQTYKKEFMLLSTMLHHRCFITLGSRLNTGWIFPVSPMEAMLRFMEHKSKQASRSSTRVCVRICVSLRRPEFECSGPQLEGPEFECSGPQLEGPEFEYSELSLKVCGSRYRELE
ncbi:hypothetical protein ANN_21703 [Periplaneta americana]|uniref:Transposable element Tcb2 transposase n=1 Tax=Periplaneta americana TaxID=6978 RepID=A0ABQ8S671_PERAM|nr:hypothetical protein ANN_21703 [Periplaneta americana]